MASRVRSTVSSATLRRSPKQQRGQRRVEQILHHAEMAFSELGFEHTTTNLIAERAEVSIGSLYQFFASKEAILEAMTERYLNQTLEALQHQIAATQTRDIQAIVVSLLELIIKQQERRPYFLQCLTGSRPSPSLNRAVNELHLVLAGHVMELLTRLGVEADAQTLKLRSQICVDTIGILLPHVVRSRGKARRQATQEIANMIVGYLRPMIYPEASA